MVGVVLGARLTPEGSCIDGAGSVLSTTWAEWLLAAAEGLAIAVEMEEGAVEDSNEARQRSLRRRRSGSCAPASLKREEEEPLLSNAAHASMSLAIAEDLELGDEGKELSIDAAERDT